MQVGSGHLYDGWHETSTPEKRMYKPWCNMHLVCILIQQHSACFFNFQNPRSVFCVVCLVDTNSNQWQVSFVSSAKLSTTTALAVCAFARCVRGAFARSARSRVLRVLRVRSTGHNTWYFHVPLSYYRGEESAQTHECAIARRRRRHIGTRPSGRRQIATKSANQKSRNFGVLNRLRTAWTMLLATG